MNSKYDQVLAFGRVVVDLHREHYDAAKERARELGMTQKAYVTKLIRDDIAANPASLKKGAKTK